MWLEAKAGNAQQPPFVLPSSNLRHSASFSCLSRSITQVSEKSYRARAATLSAVDLEYGFVIRHANESSHRRRLPSTLDCSDRLTERRQSVADCKASAAVDLKSKNDRSNSLRKVLIKKSASLLNPNVWWTPKFRRVKSAAKYTDQELQESKSSKRRCRKSFASNRQRASSMPQSSLQAPQSFYLLDDFLKPSSLQRSMNGDESAMIRAVSSLNSCDSMPTISTVGPVAGQPQSVRSLQIKNIECSLCKHRDGAGAAFGRMGETVSRLSSTYVCVVLYLRVFKRDVFSTAYEYIRVRTYNYRHVLVLIVIVNCTRTRY